MNLPGQNPTKSLFPEFSAYLLLHYPNYSHDANTNHLAFSGENVPQDNNPRHFGLAAVETVALAATSPARALDEKSEEWLAFQEWRKIQEAKKSCFYHGWNRSHDSSQCTRMKRDSKFTAAQKSFVKIPRSKNVVIDGVQCNLKCAEGVVPAP